MQLFSLDSVIDVFEVDFSDSYLKTSAENGVLSLQIPKFWGAKIQGSCFRHSPLATRENDFVWGEYGVYHEDNGNTFQYIEFHSISFNSDYWIFLDYSTVYFPTQVVYLHCQAEVFIDLNRITWNGDTDVWVVGHYAGKIRGHWVLPGELEWLKTPDDSKEGADQYPKILISVKTDIDPIIMSYKLH